MRFQQIKHALIVLCKVILTVYCFMETFSALNRARGAVFPTKTKSNAQLAEEYITSYPWSMIPGYHPSVGINVTAGLFWASCSYNEVASDVLARVRHVTHEGMELIAIGYFFQRTADKFPSESHVIRVVYKDFDDFCHRTGAYKIFGTTIRTFEHTNNYMLLLEMAIDPRIAASFLKGAETSRATKSPVPAPFPVPSGLSIQSRII